MAFPGVLVVNLSQKSSSLSCGAWFFDKFHDEPLFGRPLRRAGRVLALVVVVLEVLESSELLSDMILI